MTPTLEVLTILDAIERKASFVRAAEEPARTLSQRGVLTEVLDAD